MNNLRLALFDRKCYNVFHQANYLKKLFRYNFQDNNEQKLVLCGFIHYFEMCLLKMLLQRITSVAQLFFFVFSIVIYVKKCYQFSNLATTVTSIIKILAMYNFEHGECHNITSLINVFIKQLKCRSCHIYDVNKMA